MTSAMVDGILVLTASWIFVQSSVLSGQLVKMGTFGSWTELTGVVIFAVVLICVGTGRG